MFDSGLVCRSHRCLLCGDDEDAAEGIVANLQGDGFNLAESSVEELARQDLSTDFRVESASWESWQLILKQRQTEFLGRWFYQVWTASVI